MRPSFSSYLVNDVFGDPGLYIEIKWARRALLFDLGQNTALGATRLLRAEDIFVSHTHMDHFIGFDQLLRVHLGRGKTVRLYGPPGLADNVEGKLRGYTWNLTDGYPLTIEVHEFHAGLTLVASFTAAKGFARHEDPPRPGPQHGMEQPFPVLEEASFRVLAVPLNHRIFSFAYALQEEFHVNILKERLHEAGLPVGSWLKDLKHYIWQNKPDDFRFTATLYFEHRREVREFVLGDIRKRFVRISPGQKIAYVVDARYDDENEGKIVELARGADVLYCEAPYLHVDSDKAGDRYHLTARQAGLMAKRAAVRKLVVFHFSPRYTGMGEALEREAQTAFESSEGGDRDE